MEARTISCCLVLALEILVSLVSATSRPFPPNHGFATDNQPVTSQTQQPSHASLASESGTQLSSNQGIKSRKERAGGGGGGGGGMDQEAYYSKGIGKIGSSPPNCEHKCYGCTPCEAIQVPTTSRSHGHNLSMNYANYEPEGWKCKCGPSFYSP